MGGTGRISRCNGIILSFDLPKSTECHPASLPSISPAGHSIKILRADEGQTNLHVFAIIVALAMDYGGRRYHLFNHLPFLN